MPNILLRGGVYYLRRRVPVKFRSVEPRSTIWLSLRTDSLKEATRRSGPAWLECTRRWEALLAGGSTEAAARFDAAREIARMEGFRYLPSEAVAELPIDQIVDRLTASARPRPDAKGEPVLDPVRAGALLGLTKKPVLRLSGVLDDYWALAEDKFHGMSEDQIRRARNPRKKAFANLIKVVGDIPAADLGTDDMLDLREWWWRRIIAEGLTKNAANKDFSYIASTFRLVNQKRRLGLLREFDGLAFGEEETPTRLAFSEKWIADKLLAQGALDGLNTEARCILLGMINTGYRPSEAQGLLPHHIRLEGKVPHISIEPEGRKLKTATSRRVIPLAGVSLKAFRQCPDGFPRYRGSPSLSATVNKFLRANGLLESENHSLYGLRHSFEDRLLDRDVDERIRCDLMGHALKRERYGMGASLDKLAAVVRSIAL